MASKAKLIQMLLVVVLALLLTTKAGAAEAIALELGSPFVDDAILQRQMPVPVWGWAQPGAKVEVSFAGQRKTATADAKGKWRVELDPLTASLDERELAVRSGDQSITRKGVLVGEVWFSSGQSNMDWVAGKSMVRDLAVRAGKENLPIREYNVDIGSSLYPCTRADSQEGWKRAGQAGNFSALSLAFAAELYDELKVPIGIVRATHGATPVETWTAYEGFADRPALKDIAERIRESNPTTAEGTAAFAAYYEALQQWQKDSEAVMARGGEALPRPALPGIAEDWKGPSRMFNKKIAPLVPYAVRGAIWCQGTHNAGDGRIYAEKMQALVDGWRQHWGRPDMPFYFTQMQCYGEADANNVGFADIRAAQALFFTNNLDNHVGMVVQVDLNPATPGNIHYFNKLDPGKRLARWALAHEYGRSALAYTGPIYQSHTIQGDTVRVTFNQRGPGGKLIVASKGMEADAKNSPDAYVEPARATPDQPLRHFRVAGSDRVWHDAEATIVDAHTIVVRSKDVPKPVGVQYAYSASPIGANLYNQAGLPAVPFAYFDGRQMFEQDRPGYADEQAAQAARWQRKPGLKPAALFRTGSVVQCDQPIPVWGHGIPGSTITVTFADQTKTTTVGEFEYWQLTLDALPASHQGRDLVITSDKGESFTIKDVWVGDVWFLTGTRQLDGELMKVKDDQDALPALEGVRELRVKTKTRRFKTPRKMDFEIGGGKYVASWQPADFDAVGDPPSVFAYYFAAQVKRPGVPLGIVTLGSPNPPITWVSYEGVQTAKGFEAERDELNLAYPNTESCKRAVVQYIETVKAYNAQIKTSLEAGDEVPAELADSAPPFPQPYFNEWSDETQTPTHTYNFCISPLTPWGVRGVVWVPDAGNIGSDTGRYSASLEVYANSLAQTYGQARVRFVYAHPLDALVPGVGQPKLEKAMGVVFDRWPKSLESLATKMGKAAAGME